MASQLLGITYKNGSVTLDTISYTLNIQGNRNSRTQGTLTENYTYDPLGNVVALTNAASYLVLETYTYDPFGKRTVYNATGQQIPDTAYANTHGYTGREHLPLSGLMDYRNRTYSTTLGRFLQTDPIRFDAGDVNLYRYVGNEPINLVDPSGRIAGKYIHAAFIAAQIALNLCKNNNCKEPCIQCCDAACVAGITALEAAFVKDTIACGVLIFPKAVAGCVAWTTTFFLAELGLFSLSCRECQNVCNSKPSIKPPDCCKP